MPNIANALKAEISRIARKEIRADTASLKKAVSTYRAEIAALKRRTQILERELRGARRLSKPAAPAAEEASSVVTRFSAKGLVAQRRRLGISARECGLLLGTSAQTIYNWEEGKVRPRARHLPAIAALRGLGRKDARAHLQSIA